MSSKQIGIVVAVAVVAALLGGLATYAVIGGGQRGAGTATGGSGGSAAGGGAGSGKGGGATSDGTQGGGQAPGGTAPGGSASGAADAYLGIPVVSQPERTTVAFFDKSFATGNPRYSARLKVVGWQGDPKSNVLIVRFSSAKAAGGGTVKGKLDIKNNDYSVTLERPIKGKADVEGKAVTVEFRAAGGAYQAFLLP